MRAPQAIPVKRPRRPEVGSESQCDRAGVPAPTRERRPWGSHVTLLLAFLIAACGGKSDAQKAAEQVCNSTYQLAIQQLAGYYGGEDSIPADELATLDRALQECLRDAENVDSILGI